MVEVQTQVRVASGVKAIVVQAADRVEPLDSECTTKENKKLQYTISCVIFPDSKDPIFIFRAFKMVYF